MSKHDTQVIQRLSRENNQLRLKLKNHLEENAKSIIAIVKSQGGELRIPERFLHEIDTDDRLATYADPQTGEFVLKVVQENPQPKSPLIVPGRE